MLLLPEFDNELFLLPNKSDYVNFLPEKLFVLASEKTPSMSMPFVNYWKSGPMAL